MHSHLENVSKELIQMTSITSINLMPSIPYPLASSVLLTKQSGFSFLELLISLVIFAIGFLGLASLQHVSIKMTHDTVLQNSAMALSSALIEQLRLKGESISISAWQERVKKELPQGSATLVDQGDRYRLTMQWQESQHSEHSDNLQFYEMSFKITP
ncbi:MAG: prepilin-type N-terminal cleavage/methylation domain-containing protein [Oleiphilaceae bacterium]|jgi:type IV pilus assembly protein PilV